MPPKRRRGEQSDRETRSTARSQSTAPLEEGHDAETVLDSPSGTHSRGSSVVITGERVAPNRLRPKKERTRGGVTPSRGRGGRNRAAAEGEVPDVYRDMLRDVVGTSASRPQELSDSDEIRLLKKRKATNDNRNEVEASGSRNKKKEVLADNSENDAEKATENVIMDDVDSEGSEESFDESEVDWEEVDLSKQLTLNLATKPPKHEHLELVLDQKGKHKAGPARRIITAVDRRIRLEVHKMHLLCLLIHVYQRSRWCNDSSVKTNLRPWISKEVHFLLNPDPDDQQFRRSYNFLEGLKKAVEIWQKNFRITRKGVFRPRWHDMETLKIILAEPPKDGEPPINKDHFLTASVSLSGSRDLGAQLFCAFLRSAGVICRLVCSLQPLPFSFQDKAALAKPKPTIPLSSLEAEEHTSSDTREIQVNNRLGGPRTAMSRGRPGGLRRPMFREPVIKTLKPTKAPPVIIRESTYPVYWVEAWNMATQKWIAVDPLVTTTIGKPGKIEPPMSDAENLMSYVIAFEEEGQVQDVTRRYAKSYNGKTRKLRVSCTKGGTEWWDRVLKIFQRGWDLDRDQLELAELVQREVSEPIPNNIQDLKDHPLFALKRHLKRGETIHPEKRVGCVTIGTGDKKVTEDIFKRRDVKIVKSSDQWYRLGREVKIGEQPLKYVTTRPGLKRGSDDVDSDGESGEGRGKQTAMYAEFQTTIYEPPAVLYGKVPKNSFGNLDIFVPSMVPKGGVHLPHKGIAKAAKFLGVDYADAVTGFEFKNRQASATINGIVVAKEYCQAVEAVMAGFLDEQNEAEEFKKTIEALKHWRRFLMAMRIRQRLGMLPEDVQEQSKEKNMTKGKQVNAKLDEGGEDTGCISFAKEGVCGDTNISGDDDNGGGFFPDLDENQSNKGESDMEILEDPDDEDLGWF